MTRVLFVGETPDAVDYSDPTLPPGMNAEKIKAGIKAAMDKIAERGWEGDECMIPPDDSAPHTIEQQLRRKSYDCVVVGAGLRLPPKSLALFETVVNAIHRAAPDAAIAFNTVPEDTVDAASRVMGTDR